ncbi:uncharacterized protein BN629_01213 [Eggerthella sp. CAG:368]|nr:uncharacterized protein BN629_01213 [Eggerthella sp. CAG:368]
MISDEERREVAARLRGLDEATATLSQVYSRQEYDAMVLSAIRAVVGEGDIFHLLADLIDRPTCELDHIDTDPAQDGYPLRLHECSNCRRLCYEIYGEFEYCPHCGAEVQE